MTKRMLIDAGHPEETRVVIVDGTKVEELDFESAAKKQLRGNLYLARVTRVEPSLQAAFVEYGGNRHGFLAFSEIHPDYYQIPYEDRMALLEAEEAEALELEAEEEAEEEAKKKRTSKKKPKATRSRKPKSKNTDPENETDGSETELSAQDDESLSEKDSNADHSGDDAPTDESSETQSEPENVVSTDDDSSESATEEQSSDTNEESEDGVEVISDDADEDVADEQEKTAKRRRSRSFRNRYKIQEVIKRGQILLIQVVKEERGNKGAAMTTYLSLAGRYCVLMPNTPKGGGISRKIANGSDRKRLKSIVSEFEVPQGMGVIVRTAGAKRTKTEVKRDYDYLCRLWETIRDKTLKSIAPALIHEEGNLVKRSIRDLYNKDIKEVFVQGDEAYKNAKDFIKMLMPSHAKNVKAYKDEIPLFLRYQVESQIEESLESVVQLKSGGYLVIHPTEALVSVDVNSGRSTKERNVERTALKTNLEAAVEVARQMRLRDLAGLVVIDFIDMDEYRNNRAVEKKMKEALSQDRARVQAGRISQFGLMEISRQRRRRSLLEGSTISCPHCEGVGRKRTIESSALKALRAIEELAARGQTLKARLKVAPDVAAFILNQKREQLQEIHDKFGMYAVVEADPEIMSPEFSINDEEKRVGKHDDPLASIEKELKKEKAKAEKTKKSKTPKAVEEDEDDDEQEPKKRRRRGRRGGRKRKPSDNDTEQDGIDDKPEADAEAGAKDTDEASKEEGKPKRRSRRRSTKKVASGDITPPETTQDTETLDDGASDAEKPKRRRARKTSKKGSEVQDPANTAPESNDEKPTKKTRRRPSVKSKKTESQPEKTEVTDTPAAKPEAEKEAKKPRRSTVRRKAPSKASDETDSEKGGSDSEVETKAPKKKTPRRTKRKDAETSENTEKTEKKDSGKKRTGWWSRKG